MRRAVLEQALQHPRLEVGLPLGAEPPVQVHQRRRGAVVSAKGFAGPPRPPRAVSAVVIGRILR